MFIMKTSVVSMLLLQSGFYSIHAFQTVSQKCSRPMALNGVKDLYAEGKRTNDILGSTASSTSANRSSQSSLATPSFLVQGNSLRTWSYRSHFVEQVQVILSTEGRPLDADIELWNGPDNTPCKMRVYLENGLERPFCATLMTPRGPNTIAIKNIGQLEFPISAKVIENDTDGPSDESFESLLTIQGGALRTYPFSPLVESVQVYLNTDGRPLNARIELLQGPNNNKQVVELFSEDGFERPFFMIINTPWSGNVVRVINTAPMEFPLSASVVANSIKSDYFSDAIVGGDTTIGEKNVAW